MSAASRWSHTSTATLWPLTGRNDATGVATYGPPVPIACDYSAEAMRMTDATGVEFTTRQLIHTERADIKQGDMILIGTSTALNPHAAGAYEVRAVTRYADTFEGQADDYRVAT